MWISGWNKFYGGVPKLPTFPGGKRGSEKVRHLFHHRGDPIVRNNSQMIVRSMKLLAVSRRHVENVDRRCSTILIAKFRDATRTPHVKNRSRSAGRCRARCIYRVLRCTLWLVSFSHVNWRTQKLELELIIETFIRRNYTWENKGAENSFPVTYVPTLTSFGNITTLKTGFVVTDSSQPGRGFVPMNVFNGFYARWKGSGGEGATDGETSNFYLQVQCPKLARLWRVALRGRDSNTQRIFNWNIQGSTK